MSVVGSIRISTIPESDLSYRSVSNTILHRAPVTEVKGIYNIPGNSINLFHSGMEGTIAGSAPAPLLFDPIP